MKNRNVNASDDSAAALDKERILVQRIKDGDGGALDELIQQYGGKIYYLALQYTKNPQDAEEVLQDVFLKVFRKINTFRAEARLSPWLYKIAVNTSLMKLREQKKHRTSRTISLDDTIPSETGGQTPVAAELQDLSANAQDVLLQREVQEMVRHAIDRLPSIYRTVVQLRDIDGFSLEEISDILHISIPAVKSRLHRARLTIHKSIARFKSQQEKKPALAH